MIPATNSDVKRVGRGIIKFPTYVKTIAHYNTPVQANIPPTIPHSLMRNFQSGLYFCSTYTFIGEKSYLKNMPGVP